MSQSLSNTIISKKMFIIFILGFYAGFPLALSASTLQLWYQDAGIDITTIGLLSLVTQPYIFKITWAPAFDYIPPPFLSRRKGWMIVCQVVMALVLICMSFFNPALTPIFIAGLAFALCTLSASQDIVFDAYRTEVLAPGERGFGSAWYTAGYRIAMFVSGGLALILADKYGFNTVYGGMGLIMLFAVIASFNMQDKDTKEVKEVMQKERKEIGFNVLKGFYGPTKEFSLSMSRFRKIDFYLVIAFVLLYKIGDAFAFSLISLFLVDLGFSLTEIGTVNKLAAMVSTLTGVWAAGFAIKLAGLYRSLLIFGVLQCVSNLMLVYLSMIGNNFLFMLITLVSEYFCGGMGTAAFGAVLMGFCVKKYAAYNYALLSAISAVGRVYLPAIAGFIVAAFGWTNFFIMSFFIAIPGIIAIVFLKRLINAVDSAVEVK